MQQKHQDNGPEVQKQCGKLEEKPSTSSTLTPLCPPVFVDDCLFDLEMERKQTRAIDLDVLDRDAEQKYNGTSTSAVR